eukprot:10605581-Alexandrium_andersonii.AAC.2
MEKDGMADSPWGDFPLSNDSCLVTLRPPEGGSPPDPPEKRLKMTSYPSHSAHKMTPNPEPCRRGLTGWSF